MGLGWDDEIDPPREFVKRTEREPPQPPRPPQVALDVYEKLLTLVVKVVREDRAVTPGVTRLARLCAEIEHVLAGGLARFERCRDTDSNGVQCEVLGPHREHACPRQLARWSAYFEKKK